MEIEWKTAKVLAKEFSLSESTLRSMDKRKQIRSKFIQDSNGKNYKVYSVEDLSKRKGRVATGVAESPEEFSQKNSSETLPNDIKEFAGFEKLAEGFNLSEIEKQRFLAAVRVGKFGSESILKAEQAFSKMRENLVDEKYLIDIRSIAEDLEMLFALVWSLFKEQIETWQLRYNLPAKQSQEMLQDYLRVLERVREKAKALNHEQSSS